MTWYRTGTVTVTNGSANVTLAGGDALQNIFPDDGFVGPDGRTYAILTVGGAGSFTLSTNYEGPTVAGANYLIIPSASFTQLRDVLTQVNALIADYQAITLNAGVGKFEPGSAASPGVRANGYEGSGLVWNADGSVGISVNGTIVATFDNDNAISLIRATNGDALDVGKTTGQRLRVYADDTTIGLFNVAGAGPGRDGLRILDGAVAFDIAAAEIGRFNVSGLNISGPSGTLIDLINTSDENRAGRLRITTGAFQINTTSGVYALSFGIDNVERARISAEGRFGIGTATPAAALHVKIGGEIQRLETTTARGGGACYQAFYDPSGAKGFCGYSAIDDGFDIWNSLNHQIRFGTNGTYRWAISSAGGFYPIADNAYTIGGSVNRVSEIYAVNGTINTSDARDKTWRGAPIAAELRAARRIAAELGFYQWNAAIDEKGADGARMHFGVRAQAVWAIMADEGLIEPLAEGETPSSRYAFLCWDKWDEQREPLVETVEHAAIYEGRGKNRKLITEAYTERVDTGKIRITLEAGDRYGIRIDQLNLFLIAAQEARINAIEERLSND